MGPFGSEGGDETPAGREVEGDVEAFGIGLPAGGAEGTREGGAAGGGEVEVAAADFDAFGFVGRVAGDELAFAVDFDGTELLAWGGVETPCVLTGAGEPVAPCEAAAVFVEPEFAFEFEAWGTLSAHAAHFFVDGEGGLGFPEVERETAPAFGHGGLGDVDGGDVAEFDDAEGWVGLEGDEFLRG